MHPIDTPSVCACQGDKHTRKCPHWTSRTCECDPLGEGLDHHRWCAQHPRHAATPGAPTTDTGDDDPAARTSLQDARTLAARAGSEARVAIADADQSGDPVDAHAVAHAVDLLSDAMTNVIDAMTEERRRRG